MLLGDKRGLHQLVLIFPSQLRLQTRPPLPHILSSVYPRSHTVSPIPPCLSVAEVVMSGWAAAREREGGRRVHSDVMQEQGWQITIKQSEEGGKWEEGEEREVRGGEASPVSSSRSEARSVRCQSHNRSRKGKEAPAEGSGNLDYERRRTIAGERDRRQQGGRERVEKKQKKQNKNASAICTTAASRPEWLPVCSTSAVCLSVLNLVSLDRASLPVLSPSCVFIGACFVCVCVFFSCKYDETDSCTT